MAEYLARIAATLRPNYRHPAEQHPRADHAAQLKAFEAWQAQERLIEAQERLNAIVARGYPCTR